MTDQETTKGSFYGPKYPKINSMYKRDEKKKLLIGDYADPVFEALKDIEWEGTEKVDGMNIRVHWNGEEVLFAGRTDAAMLPTALVSKLNQRFTTELFRTNVGVAPMTIFGEGYGEKIQSGGEYIVGGVDFIAFDILLDNHYWLPRYDMMYQAAQLGLKTVPRIFIGTLAEAASRVSSGIDSQISELPRKAEGLVLKPSVGLRSMNGERIITKLKTKDFA